MLHISSIKQEFPEVGIRYSVVLKSSPGSSPVHLDWEIASPSIYNFLSKLLGVVSCASELDRPGFKSRLCHLLSMEGSLV